MSELSIPSIAETRKAMAEAAKGGWNIFNDALMADTDNSLVKVDWEVIYDPLGRDIILDAKVAVADSADSLLQVWLMDEHPGFWIPEIRPWVSAVVEFDPKEGQQTAHLGLFDSKWTKEDAGATYVAFLWGYVLHEGTPTRFAYQQDFTYPG